MGSDLKLLEDVVLAALLKSSGGLTVHQIRDRVASDMAVHELTDLLIGMRQKSMVHLVKGHLWRARDVYPADAIGTALAGEAVAPTPWSDVRKLCRYYRDCNLLSGSKGMTLWPDRENRHFVQMTSRMDWSTLIKGEYVYLPSSAIGGQLDDPQSSQTGVSPFLLGIQKDPQCYFCGPLFIPGGMAPILPVFINPCSVEWLKEQSLLRIGLTSPPEINEEWLKSIARNADRRNELMMYFGEEEAASEEALDSVSQRPDFFELYSRLRKMIQGDEQLSRQCCELPCLPSGDDPTPIDKLPRRGYYNRLLLVRQSSAIFTQRLQKELRAVSAAKDEDLEHSALALIRPVAESVPSAAKPKPSDLDSYPAQVEVLSPDQRRACSMALANPVSLVSGPPGTGKSRVVANAMVNALLEGKSVLFASRNHQALDAVVPYLNEMGKTGLVVGRLSVPQDQNVADPLRECLMDLLDCNPEPGAADEIAGTVRDVKETRTRIQALQVALHQTSEMHVAASEAMTQAEELLQATGNAQSDIFNRGEKLRAGLNAFPDGNTPEKLLEHLKASYLSAAQMQHRFWLLRKLFAWLRDRRLRFLDTRWHALRPMLENVFVDTPTQRLFSSLSFADATGAHIQEVTETFDTLARFCRAAEAVGEARRRQAMANSRESVDSVQQRIRQEENRLVAQTRKALSARVRHTGHDMSDTDRVLMDNLMASLKAGASPARLQALFRKAFPVLLRFSPLWAVSNLSAGRYLPLSAGLFDLLIIDEASQCDIPSVIPLLYRCRRVMVVGDRKQLSFIAGISKAANQRLRTRHELQDCEPFDRYDFRTRTFYDLVNGLAQTTKECRVMLRDHYRCDPGIARYFNQAFYGDRLFINTDLQKLRKPDKNPVAIRWHECPADARKCPSGGATSESQIEAICDELKRLAETGFPGTVGVVTPFRSQADRIRDCAGERFASRFPQHWDFKSSTADGFQGGERDLILMSLVGGPDLPTSCEWFYQDDPNRFNVAVSRARAVLQVYGNKAWTLGWASQLPRRRHIGLLAELATDDTEPLPIIDSSAPRPAAPPIDGNPDLIGPVWEPRFAQALWDAGLPARKQYPACGRSLDIALIRDGLKLGIEVDGEAYHRDSEGNRKQEDIERDLVLMANGWTIKRFWVYELREKWQESIDTVIRLWKT